MSEYPTYAMGWLRDLPDIRDYWIEIKKPPTSKKTKSKSKQFARSNLQVDESRVAIVADESDKLGTLKFPFPPPAKHLDNVKWCSPIEDQLSLGSCTAQAGVGLLEYYQRRVYGKHLDGSRLFLYKVTRNLLGWTGDTGAYCRTTLGAMALFGVALEKYWPYSDQDPDFDVEPTSFAYALAQNYQGLLYHRVDAAQASLPILTRIKLMISVGWPVMFGFTCYSSIFDANVRASGEIPWPTAGEGVVGGHAVVAVGYDDNKVVKNTRYGNVETKGAFLIRNSWGTNWGCVPPSAPAGTTRGYGWLPYEYLERGQATDWWTLTKVEWLDANVFDL